MTSSVPELVLHSRLALDPPSASPGKATLRSTRQGVKRGRVFCSMGFIQLRENAETRKRRIPPPVNSIAIRTWARKQSPSVGPLSEGEPALCSWEVKNGLEVGANYRQVQEELSINSNRFLSSATDQQRLHASNFRPAPINHCNQKASCIPPARLMCPRADCGAPIDGKAR